MDSNLLGDMELDGGEGPEGQAAEAGAGSTGPTSPRSEEDKAVSSRNAVRHGLTAMKLANVVHPEARAQYEGSGSNTGTSSGRRV